MIILGGEQVDVPGVLTRCWVDEPARVKRITKTTPRTRQVRAVVAHTVHGKKSKGLKPGGKPSDADYLWGRSQVNSPRAASWDFTVDTDGSVVWQNDPLAACAWHASQVNPFTLGFEMVTDPDGTMYEATVDAAARTVAFLCRRLGIQAQTPWDALHDRPEAGRIARLDPGRAGADVVGVYGHRNVWVPRSKEDPTLVPARGFGDPNDYLFAALVNDHRFERFAYVAPAGQDPEDVRVWKERQARLGFTGRDVDGLPLRRTTDRLRAAGHPNGIWADSVAVPTPR